MELKTLLGIKKGNMISIVGADGKSTLMMTLSNELRTHYKVLLTTTTKIFVPSDHEYDHLAIGKEQLEDIKQPSFKGIVVYGNTVNSENKLMGTIENLNHQLDDFDIIILEADGSKRKPIKGWNEWEPVIPEGTDITIGVLSIHALGMEINENNVHRVKEFIAMTHSKEKQIITYNDLVAIIFHPSGLFKNAEGEKIVFINQVENDEQMEKAQQLVKEIYEKNQFYSLIDKVIIGSLKNKFYQQL